MPPYNHRLSGRGAHNAKRTKLQVGMDSLGTDFAPGQLDSVLHYLDLLERWNKAYNLTAIRDPLQMIDLHFR